MSPRGRPGGESRPSHPPPLVLNIESDAANLRAVRVEVEEFCHLAGLEPKASQDVGLCANEAVANVIRHAYHSAPGKPICVRAEAQGDGVRLTIRDWGKPFDPSTQPPKPRDPLCPGGLGLVCMRRLMDEVHFSKQEPGTLLTMIKRRAPRAADSE